MDLFLITTRYGGNETEQYVPARSLEEAIEIAKRTLPGRVRRWATVFG